MSEHQPAAEPRPQRGKRRTLVPVLIAVGVLIAVAAGGGAWWFGTELPARQATAAQASAQAAEQALVDAAAKKKADDSAAFWASVDQDNKAAAETEAQRRVAAAMAPPVDRIKPQMEAQGWTQFSGDFYYQYAGPSEFSCGYFNCIVVHVTTMAANGCPGGLYVEATVDMGDATVGRANSITAALPQGKDAIVKLQDTTGHGDKLALTELRCLGG